MNTLTQLAIDLKMNALGNFSKEDANKSLRKEILEVLGGKEFNYKTYRRNRYDIFELVEEAIDILLVEGVQDQFNNFVEIKNTGWGDLPVFKVNDTATFAVATIADGITNLRRQRLDSGNLTVTTVNKGIKVYEEMYRFLAGRVEWDVLVNKAVKSYNQEIAGDIYTAFYGAYTGLATPYAVSGAFVASEMDALVDHVEAATGATCTIWGVKPSLRKITPTQISDEMKKERNEMGYYGTYNGTSVNMIKQCHTPGTDTFTINSDFVAVIPNLDDKLIKLVIEGDTIIVETPFEDNADLSQEYTFIKKSGIGVIAQNKFGMYRFA